MSDTVDSELLTSEEIDYLKSAIVQFGWCAEFLEKLDNDDLSDRAMLSFVKLVVGHDYPLCHVKVTVAALSLKGFNMDEYILDIVVDRTTLSQLKSLCKIVDTYESE